jgi:hypothetical protein
MEVLRRDGCGGAVLVASFARLYQTLSVKRKSDLSIKPFRRNIGKYRRVLTFLLENDLFEILPNFVPTKP